jgi:hypothetical protein
MNEDHKIKIDDVLASMRETIGTQAQEIAVLKATIAALISGNTEADS